MFVHSISDADGVAQRVVAAIFLLLLLVYCARPLVEHPMARGPLKGGNLREIREMVASTRFFSSVEGAGKDG